MSRLIAAIDQGTTSTRCILFDSKGIVAVAQKEHEQIFPRPGWVEHDPIEIWHRTEEVVAEALRAGDVKSGEVAAIGIANQRETTVVWDKVSGRPFCNAIVWQDTRTKELVDALAGDRPHPSPPPAYQGRGKRKKKATRSANGGLDRFRKVTGLPLATYFSGPKIRWILENVPEVREAVKQGRAVFGTIDTWLIWNLTGGTRGGAHV
ncbi:MAG TPA: FGGY family carbohydrate kinase, partial [Tepidisphaeraceae bacterium]